MLPQVPYGPVERKKNRNRGLAAMYRRGAPSGFHMITWWASGATGAMSETQPVTTPAIDFFRVPDAEPTFPTEDCGIQARLREAKGRGTFAPAQAGLDDSSMHHRAAENPVALAIEYNRYINAILSTLYGIQQSKNTRTTYTGNRGVFGPAQDVNGGHETQTKGILHGHVLFNGGLPPWVIQAVCHNQTLQLAVARVIDSHYKGFVAPEVLIDGLNTKLFKLRKHRYLYDERPPVLTPSGLLNPDFTAHVEGAMSVTNTHKCTLTCIKNGCNACRCARPQPTYISTHVVQLTAPPDPERYHNELDAVYAARRKRHRNKAPPIVIEVQPPPPPPPNDRRKQPLRNTDDRCLHLRLRRPAYPQLATAEGITNHLRAIQDYITPAIMENEYSGRQWRRLQRRLPERNRAIVETNPVVAAATCANTNMSPLGSLPEAGAGFGYANNYSNKMNSEKPEHATVTFNTIVKKAYKNRDKAYDAETNPARLAQTVCQMIQNKATARLELSEHLCAAILLSMPASVNTSDVFYLNMSDTIAHMLSCMHGNHNSWTGAAFFYDPEQYNDSDDDNDVSCAE